MILNPYIPNTVIGSRPDDGVSAEKPFDPIATGSAQFRIPAAITLSDGTIVTAADARWNTCADGCGLDTIVSVSEDNGKSWRFTYANYLGDNGNSVNVYSTAFIDPCLLAKDDVIYLLVDLWPGGVALNSSKYRPVPSTGYDENGRLLLRTYATDSYDYRLGESDGDGMAKIVHISGEEVPDYTVDRWFNLYWRGKPIHSNLFYFTSPYRVCPTSFLYLTKSEDKGRTWSAPVMLNPMVKNGSEPFYGIGPGRGLVTQSGRMMFPCYYHNRGEQGMSFIFSDDGENWMRTPTLGFNQSSEAQLVELSDGKIRAFFRNWMSRLCYADAEWNGENYVWGEIVKTEAELYGRASNCQTASLKLSFKVDGCDVLLAACPANPGQRRDSGRFGGTIHTFLYDPATGETRLHKRTPVNGADDFYGYSCLTELSDGSVGLIWESESDTNFIWKSFPVSDLI